MKKIIFLNIYKMLVAFLGLAMALPLIAADTGQINYQARLLDSYGRRVNGTVNLSFKIYDAATAGNLLWSETHSGIVVQDGVYSVILGSQTALPASAFAQNTVYLELGINGETMSPRQQMTAAAYALVSRTVMGSNIFENQTSGDVGIGTTNPLVKLDVNGTVNMLGFKMPTGATDNYVLVSDADGNGNWEPMSILLDEKDPVFTNWVNVTYNPSTNSIWAAIGQRALQLDVSAATNDMWDAAGGINARVLSSTYIPATGALWAAVNLRALQSDVSGATNDMWNSGINARVRKAGDIMTGPLTNELGFFGDGGGLTNISAEGVSLTGVVHKVGDTMTGLLIVSNNAMITGTNQVNVLNVTNSIILQDAAAITNWRGLTNDVLLGAIYARRDTGVTNIAVNVISSTNIAQGGISNYNIAVGGVYSNNIDWTTMPAGLVDGTVASNWARYPALINVNMGGNSLSNSAQVERWNNAVVLTEGTAGDTIAYSNLYYYKASDSKWWKANAVTNTTAQGMLGLALGDAAADAPLPAAGLLLNGYCTNAWGFAAGSIIYMDTNSGALATSMPTGTNNIVRIVGYAISASKIYFNPDRSYIEILGQ